MIGVCGTPQAAMEVAREAMDRVAETPRKSLVPECWPALVAVLGGVDEAYAAIDREPLLLIRLGTEFLGKLKTLRGLVGKDGAREVLRKAPYFMLHEKQRKSHKFKVAFAAMERLFGREETQRRVLERPEILALGVCLERALNFAERKLGSREAVRENFEAVLQRTGLEEHLVTWEVKPRPRQGMWTPKSRLARGYPTNPCSWSPTRNPTGRAGVPRGRWDEEEEEEDDDDIVEAELVLPAGAAAGA
mmetsp:Transcript_87266/g.264719  ORF Transcript_87266/g.264719 Transcript_87266/m.264719 type:complete len:247 (+) Transcript_87266:2-742(+)